MNKIPFTVYDFFAYLSSGSVLVATVDLLHGNRWLLQKDRSLEQNLLLILLAYVVGHVVAQLSSLILEKGLVKALKYPSTTLMALSPKAIKRQAVSWVFRLHYHPLPKETRDRIHEHAKAAPAGEPLFTRVLGVVKQNKDVMPPLDQFMNLYGFARNMTLSLLAAAILIWIGPSGAGFPIPTSWAWLAAFLSVVMLFRYLKFFRQYTYELFVVFAELKVARS